MTYLNWVNSGAANEHIHSFLIVSHIKQIRHSFGIVLQHTETHSNASVCVYIFYQAQEHAGSVQVSLHVDVEREVYVYPDIVF